MYLFKNFKKLTFLLCASLLYSCFFPFLVKATEPQNSYLEEIQTNKYILGPGDIIQINLLNEPELSNKFEVLVDGKINLPLLGEILVKGLTLNSAAEKIENLYKKEILSPRVSLFLVKKRPIIVSIIGEISTPGIYKFEGKKNITNNENSNLVPMSGNVENPTIVNAIQEAGGFTKSANLKDVIVKRKLPGQSSEYKSASLNLLDMLLNGDLSQNIYLYDGDVIEIKRFANKNNSTIQFKNSNLAKQNIDIYVVGEVANPGMLKVKSQTTLASAILAAGGPNNNRANYSNVELIRANENGSLEYKKYKLDFKTISSISSNPTLQDKDIIRVKRSAWASTIDQIDSATKPIQSIAPILTLIQILDDD